MANLTTTYQRDRLKRSNALGVVAIFKGDGEWEFVVVNPLGERLKAVGPFVSEGDATRAGMAWVDANYPERSVVALT